MFVGGYNLIERGVCWQGKLLGRKVQSFSEANPRLVAAAVRIAEAAPVVLFFSLAYLSLPTYAVVPMTIISLVGGWYMSYRDDAGYSDRAARAWKVMRQPLQDGFRVSFASAGIVHFLERRLLYAVLDIWMASVA